MAEVLWYLLCDKRQAEGNAVAVIHFQRLAWSLKTVGVKLGRRNPSPL